MSLSVGYEDKICPRCGSSEIDWVDYYIVDVIGEFDDTEVCVAAVWMHCGECGYEWESEGIVTRSREE